MPTIPKYTSEVRKMYREKGAESLFFFAQAILGFKDMAENPHLELCENLDGRGEWGKWRRGLVTASRAFLKSSICTIAWPIRQGLYNQNWSCRIIGSSYDNAKTNFFDPAVQIFTQSDLRNFLLWLYGDPDDDPKWFRIPENYNGWTDKRIIFNRSNPLAQPAISFKGMGSDQEGYHGDCIIIDDPEGADAERSAASSEEAYKTVFSVAPPLLIDQRLGQILVVGTPHGDNPLIYRILEDKDGRIEWDNAKRPWKYWFKPILDGEGKPNWEERTGGPEEIAILKATVDEKTWDQQYMLRKTSAASMSFDMKSVEEGFYRWKVKGKLLEYPVRLFDQKLWMSKGIFKSEIIWREAHVAELRYFVHVDFTHKKDTVGDFHKGNRPSKAAIVAIGVSADAHAFVMGFWTDKVDLDEQARQVYRYYSTFAPHQVTFDPVGAQVWFKTYAEMLEKSDPAYQRIRSSGRFSKPGRLPRLSSRLVEDKRSSRESKDAVITDRLRPWIESNTLHFNADQDELLFQLKGFPDDTPFVDLVDALAQGPPAWTTPMGNERTDRYRSEDHLSRRVIDKYTGYFAAYAHEPKSGLYLRDTRLEDEPRGAKPNLVM